MGSTEASCAWAYGLEKLTSYKYVVTGDGQIRE